MAKLVCVVAASALSAEAAFVGTASPLGLRVPQRSITPLMVAQEPLGVCFHAPPTRR